MNMKLEEINLIFSRIHNYNQWSELEIMKWMKTSHKDFNNSSPMSFFEKKLGYKVLKFIEDCIDNKNDLW